MIDRYTVHKYDDKTVFIDNKDFSFSYTVADYYVKDEYKGKYEYLGGLQCPFKSGSTAYTELENELIKIARFILKIK